MDRFDWRQTKEYWQSQRARAGSTDDVSDPDALGNVCHAGAPLWLNQYYARYQRQVFEQLLSQCPAPSGETRALDVGCGAGRWCRVLGDRGYGVTGIDLQEALIERNRVRYPHMKFVCLPIQEFQPEAPFDIVTTVTVIQHVPFDEQEKVVQKIASLIKPGGHALILENVLDQGVHVFARSIDDWKACFGRAGFTTVSVQRYDYSPAIRASGYAVGAASKLAQSLGVKRKAEGPAVPRGDSDVGEGTPRAAARVGRLARNVGWFARRAALVVDDRLEPFLIHRNAGLSTVHCGFLFRKSPS